MSGLLLVPDTILRSLALGAIIVGVVTMAAALTLLPALLSILGDRVNALRLPIVGRDHPAESPFWTKAVRAVLRRPAVALTAARSSVVTWPARSAAPSTVCWRASASDAAPAAFSASARPMTSGVVSCRSSERASTSARPMIAL